MLCEGAIRVRVFQDPSQTVFAHGPRRVLRQQDCMEPCCAESGVSILERCDAMAGLRSSSGGENIDSGVVDIYLPAAFVVGSVNGSSSGAVCDCTSLLAVFLEH